MVLARALDDYEGPGRHYLHFREGDLIFVIEKHPSGWWTGKTQGGMKGLLPSSLIEEVAVGSPPDELLRDLFVFQSARGVKFERLPYVCPPLNGRDDLPPAGRNGDELNLVQLLEGIQFLLVQRSTCWRRLLECVDDTERDFNRLQGTTSESPKHHGSHDRGDEQLSRRRGGLDNDIAACFVDELRNIAAEITGRGRQVFATVPPGVIDLYAVKGSCCNDVLMYRELLYERLRHCRREVRETGVELSALSKQTQEARSNLFQERQRLQRRIVIRDAKIRALLNYWSEQAEEIKAKYKEERHRYHSLSLSNVEEEERRLRRAIAEGRERYIAAEDEHNRLEKEVKEMRAHLQQRVELEEVSRELRCTAECGTPT